MATVLDALEEEKAKTNPLDHKVARALLPDYLEDLANRQAEVTELESTIKEATASANGEDEDEETDEAPLSPAELKALKPNLATARRKLRVEKAAFGTRLAAASSTLDLDAARSVVLGSIKSDLLAQAGDRISRHRQLVVGSVETWWDKYRVPLSALGSERDAAADKLVGFLKDLGYE